MIAILGTFEHLCTEFECKGEVLSREEALAWGAANGFDLGPILENKSVSLIRKAALRREDGKIIRTFANRDDAVAYAKRANFEVRQ